MFGLNLYELAIILMVCLPIVLLFGVVLKKMGFSDLTAISLAILILTPANWLVLAYLIFFKWPIQEELELLRRQVDEQAAPEGGQHATGGDASNNALHVAVRKGYSDVVEALLAQGADVNAKSPDGQTPLQIALASGQEEIADLLRRHGATA